MEIDLLPKQPLFDLTGKKALVTGSSRGLGLVVAQALANQGAKVTLNGRNETRLLVLKEKMKAFGWYCDIFVQDIAANNCIESFHQFCLEKGSPHILVNCVGQRLRQSITNSTDQEIIFHLHTNLNALILLSKHAAIKMQEMGQGGRIINFTSIAGKLARAGDTVYPIAKHGLEALVRSLAVEFGRFNITSNGIAPGTFATESNQQLANDPTQSSKVIGRNPLQRWAQPKEIAAAAVFLASNSASYVNGHILVVDGGFSITF